MDNFKLKTGKFGYYFYDKDKQLDLTLLDVLNLLNGSESHPFTSVQEELESILKHGEGNDCETVASNILSILKKCYGVELKIEDRNNKTWF